MSSAASAAPCPTLAYIGLWGNENVCGEDISSSQRPISISDDGTVYVGRQCFNNTGERQATFTDNWLVGCPSVSPDGKLIYSSCGSSVTVYDAHTGLLSSTFAKKWWPSKGRLNTVMGMCVSRDHHRLYVIDWRVHPSTFQKCSHVAVFSLPSFDFLRDFGDDPVLVRDIGHIMGTLRFPKILQLSYDDRWLYIADAQGIQVVDLCSSTFVRAFFYVSENDPSRAVPEGMVVVDECHLVTLEKVMDSTTRNETVTLLVLNSRDGSILSRFICAELQDLKQVTISFCRRSGRIFLLDGHHHQMHVVSVVHAQK
jgi:hypothetical protein